MLTSLLKNGWFYIVVTGVLFGTLGLCTKFLTTRGLDPFTCAVVPFTITALIAVAIRPRNSVRVPWLEGIAMGAANAAAPALMFNVGFSRLPASVVTLILALGPIFTALTAHLVFHDDRFSVVKGLGLALSVTGVAILAGFPSGGERPGHALALTLAGTAVSGVSLVWVKRLANLYHPRLLLAPMMVGASLLSLVVSTLIGYAPWQVNIATWQWALMTVMGVGGLITFISSLKANELNPASRAGLMGYLVPIVGVTGGALVFHESMTASLLFGGALVIAGVALVGITGRSTATLGTLTGPS
jgi:drug/metabolite transporter (DMT)-like permease